MSFFEKKTIPFIRPFIFISILIYFWNYLSNYKVEQILEAKMVLIPGGEYLMGSEHIESYVNERPIHKVKVDSFYIDVSEVTNFEFSAFVQETGYITTAERVINWDKIKVQLPPDTKRPSDSLLTPGSLVFQSIEYDNPLENDLSWWMWKPGASWRSPYGENTSIKDFMSHPVVHISWDDAVAYANWAEKRLPTEAEWEWAARGGRSKAIYPWGNESINKSPMKANFWQGHFPYTNTKKDGFLNTSPVGSYPPNNYGLFDMSGNVWEWCSDYYNDSTYNLDKIKGIAINPKGAENPYDEQEPLTEKRIMRGGSFLCNDSYCSGYRVSRRMSASYDTGLSHTGFRCVKDI